MSLGLTTPPSERGRSAAVPTEQLCLQQVKQQEAKVKPPTRVMLAGSKICDIGIDEAIGP